MFESSNRITLLCKSDYTTLTRLKTKTEGKDKRYGKSHPKLDSAVVVDDHMFPDDMARIGTQVSLKDLGTGSVARFLLSNSATKPHASDEKLRIISVTSSLGAALLGTRTGEHIKWTLPNGHTRYLRIFELVAQAAAVC